MIVHRWKTRTKRLSNSRHTLLMGVLNVTPDSFSDGGRYLNFEAAISQGLNLVGAGADIVDVGGESTRPGAAEVDPEEEIRRVVPVVKALTQSGCIVSIDTSKAQVANAALDVGAEIVNDVSSLADPEMAEVVAARGAGLVIMHMQGTPRTMQDDPRYEDVVGEVGEYLAERAEYAQASGIEREAIVLDPGLGFGKTVAHNLQLLSGMSSLVDTGYPVLVGASRKSFIGAVTGEAEPTKRESGSAAVTALAVSKGVFCVRVHEVGGNRQSALVADAIVRANHAAGEIGE